MFGALRRRAARGERPHSNNQFNGASVIATYLPGDTGSSRSREHRRMKTMLKKFAFALIAAVVLANASLAFTQTASASPNAEQGPGMDEYRSAAP